MNRRWRCTAGPQKGIGLAQVARNQRRRTSRQALIPCIGATLCDGHCSAVGEPAAANLRTSEETGEQRASTDQTTGLSLPAHRCREAERRGRLRLERACRALRAVLRNVARSEPAGGAPGHQHTTDKVENMHKACKEKVNVLLARRGALQCNAQPTAHNAMSQSRKTGRQQQDMTAVPVRACASRRCRARSAARPRTAAWCRRCTESTPPCPSSW